MRQHVACVTGVVLGCFGAQGRVWADGFDCSEAIAPLNPGHDAQIGPDTLH